MQLKEDLRDELIKVWQEQEAEKLLPATGRSMYPLIKQGDQLTIKFCPSENVKKGDIIAFRRNNKTIVHRIIKITDDKILEKGDLQERGEIISKTQIMGKVILLPHFLNYILALLGNLVHLLSPIKLLAKITLIIPFSINQISRWWRHAGK